MLVKDEAGGDLLQGNGANLIHATDWQEVKPPLAPAPVIGALTLDVDNQATASAEYTIELTFVK